jgi:ATP/maltotriose-dependent transcriptional regulator MalT
MATRQANSIRAATPRRHIIERPRLTRLLEESEAPIIVLVAPAGYGKTTLARQWLADKPHVWHSATPASADVAALAARIGEAASKLTTSDTSTLDERLHLSRDPEREVEVLVDFLGRCFAGFPEEAWLAIDDYHLLIESPAAESLIRQLPGAAGVPLLVTSRRRPTWATARRVMYGEIYEIGRHQLAMNAAEANKVLQRRPTASAPRLVPLADGWPAVIGIASLTSDSIAPENIIEDALYDFFAEEFFNTVDQATQELLCRLAVLPSIRRSIYSELLGKSSDKQLLRAEKLGLLSRAGVEWYMHPLLREFLLVKYRERDPDGLVTTATLALEASLRSREWDDAFALIDDFRTPDLFDRLIREALDELLSVGRLATLRRWVDAANASGGGSPAVRLAEAEIAFREGAHLRAEALAVATVEELPEADEMRPRGLFRVGQAAYFNEHYEMALTSFARCVAASSDQTLKREAKWAALCAALDSYHADAGDYLKRFALAREPTVNDAVRMANAELMLAMRRKGITEALKEHSSAAHLVNGVTDPMIRTAFWNVYGWALALNSRYEEAKRAADAELRDADNYRLSFVEPHAHLLAALATIGVRDISACEALLQKVFDFGHQHDDVFLLVSGSAVLARVQVARGDLAKAAEVTAAYKTADGSILHAEYLGIRSVVLAALGEAEEARAAIAAVPDQASQGEGLAFAQIAHVILASLENNESVERAGNAISEIRALGQYDVFVTGCRAYPPLVDLQFALTIRTSSRPRFEGPMTSTLEDVLA